MDVFQFLAASLARKSKRNAQFLSKVTDMSLPPSEYTKYAIEFLMKEGVFVSGRLRSDKVSSLNVEQEVKDHLKQFGKVEEELYLKLAEALQEFLKASHRERVRCACQYLAEVVRTLRFQADKLVCAPGSKAIVWQRTEFLPEALMGVFRECGIVAYEFQSSEWDALDAMNAVLYAGRQPE